MKSTKLAQLAAKLAQAGEGKPKLHDMDYFRRMRPDPRTTRDGRLFIRISGKTWLIFAMSSKGPGVKTILSTVAVNLRDCPPLGSLHRSGLTASETARWETAYTNGAAAEDGGRFDAAVRAYGEAARIDDHFADLHFRLARARLALGQTNQAREQFGLARDWDAIQFRSDRRINEIIRQTAASREAGGVRLLDAEKIFRLGKPGERRGRSRGGVVPGRRPFHF